VVEKILGVQMRLWVGKVSYLRKVMLELAKDQF
jgi:hypothetical protein